MLLKKQKSVIAVILSAALAVSSAVPSMTVSAVGTRVKQEKYGDDSYAKRFLSLYDDVITNGQENGYLSKNNVASGGFGVPYYSVEELCIESVDYGHETTSDTLSYMVWMAAMRDAISKNGTITNPDGSTTDVDVTNDLAKAWKTMEVMIPTVQTGMMQKDELSTTYSPEWEEPEMYYGDNIAMVLGNTGKNPIHKYFKNAYSGDSGLYLMHWLADVDDWYGFGGGNGKFTFINTFQRGVQESCWETVPHPSVEEKNYGNSKNGIKGIFMATTDSVAAQWDYCNDPAAEERAIQAIYYANRFGAGDSSIIVKAGKMGDQLRNNMFDSYYKKIGANDKFNMANDYSGAHYLMGWKTSWGGAMDGTWAWQTGSSQCHEISQNPLAAFALLQDEGLRNSMKATGAVNDYKTSLQRQLEFYLWLQSADGPIAGGATSSWNGRYETPKYNANDTAKYGTSTPAKFYGMSYQEHPAQLDPGSNHWIGNQVLAMQRLAEMYYVIKTEGDTTGVTIDSVNGAMTLEEALKAILDKWVEWFVGEVYLYDDGTYSIPVVLDWFGQPADWNGTYNPDANKNLTCTVTSVGSSDLGCVSSLANTLIYYAKANNINYKAAYSMNNTDAAAKGLYIANELLKREWKLGRDDIGLSLTETNGSIYRLFEQDVFIPEYYSGKMPNGDSLENGATFLSLRSQYLQNAKVKEYKTAYDKAKLNGEYIYDAMESVKLNYHRFWHAGDIMAAMAAMYNLYPEVDPNKDDSDVSDEFSVKIDSVSASAGENFKLNLELENIPDPGINACDFAISYDPSLVTINSIECGSLVPDVNDTLIDPFEYIIEPDYIGILFALGPAEKHLSGSGTFLTISGTVNASAPSTETVFQIVPCKRGTIDNPKVIFGRMDSDEKLELFEPALSSGKITIKGTSTPPPATTATTTTTKPRTTTTVKTTTKPVTTTTKATTKATTTKTTTKPVATTTKATTKATTTKTTTKPVTTTTKATTKATTTKTTTKPVATTTKTTTNTTVTTTKIQNDFVWGEDNWNFLNSGSYFKHSTYYLSDNYLDKLRENLSNTDWYYAMQWKNDYWGGSCYGMSSLALLSKEGLFPYSKYTKGADCLYDIQTPAQNSDVESLINYYQLLQVKDDIQQQYRSVPYKTHEENIKNIISQLNNSSEVLVGFKKSGWGGHAVIAYDVTYGSWTVNGVTYQGRIEILDPNYSMNYNSNACIYFNTSSYNWIIPAYSVYNVKSTSGAVFNMVLSDSDIINNGGYLSDSADTVINNFIASLEIAASSDTYDINKVVKNSDGKFSNQAAAPDEILPASFYFAGGETEGTNGYVLKDSNSGYKIQQNNAQKMDMSINYKNCLIEADAEAGTAVIFDPSGFAGINGEATNYSFNMVYDEGYYPTDWYTISISGNNADNMSIQKADNGYIMEGNNFSNVIISASNDKNSAVCKFSTDYPKVYIYEIDENAIGVSVDKDNNGTYETKLNNTISESLGDVNTDGRVTVSDIVLMQKYFTKTEKFNAVQYAVADVNIDGTVNVFDVIELKRVVMNI